jgi:hydrophobic/amphiphilic exporter-1 (mainly G- bacteria), HAE1 family
MISLRKPISVIMLTLALLIIGVQSARQLQVSFLPDIEYPEFLIICKYPGSSARELEKLVIQPLEEALSGIEGIGEMASWSRDELGILSLRFKWNSDIRYAFLRIREKTDLAMEKFPQGAERPSILDFNPGSLPALRFTLSGDMDLIALGNFAENLIRPRLAQLNGVAGTSLSGNPQQAIQIELDNHSMEHFNLKYEDIQKAIRDNLPGNSYSYDVKSGYALHKLTIEFPLHNLRDILKLPIPNNSAIPITLGDIADIKLSPLPFAGHNFSDRKPAVTINVYKEAGTNVLQAAKAAREELMAIQAQNPGVNISIISDQGTFIATAINSLYQSILLGTLLAFLTLLLFFEEIRNALLLLLMIPISLSFASIFFYIQGISLNFMTLGGIALAIGLIIDNGIVILDSMRHHYLPETPDKSIYRGIQRVKMAILASTLTTISIFLPLIYVEGYVSVIFKDQALAIVYTLLLSLPVALYVIPAVFKLSLPNPSSSQVRSPGLFKAKIGKTSRLANRFIFPFRWIFRKLLTIFRNFYQKLESAYHRHLVYFLDHKSRLFLLLLITGVIVIAGWTLRLPKQYWPDIPSDRAVLSADISDDIPYTKIFDETQKTIDKMLSHPDIETINIKTLDPRSGEEAGPDIIRLTPGYYTLIFELKFHRKMGESEFSGIDWLSMLTLPANSWKAQRTTALRQEFITQKSRNMCVYFQSADESQRLDMATHFKEWLKNTQHIENMEIWQGELRPARKAVMKEEILASYAINPSQSAKRLKMMNMGEQISVWALGEDHYPILLKNKGAEHLHFNELMQQRQTGEKLSLRNDQLFDIEKTMLLNEIRHINKKSVISVEAELPVAAMLPLIRNTEQWIQANPSESVHVFIAEESRETVNSYIELFKAFLLAALIVYLLLAAQFESFLHPLNIMLTVPVGFAGAILALLLTGSSLNVISFIGIVMLIGIGVNDAILKLDYMIKMRTEEKLSVREAILKTSEAKFRPVIITTVTTISAMFPMALGYGGNSEINQPLAVTVIGGLTLTTLFTLFITPVFFELFEKERHANS